MLLTAHMDLKFVRAVAVELTGIAPELNRVGHVEELFGPCLGEVARRALTQQLRLELGRRRREEAVYLGEIEEDRREEDPGQQAAPRAAT